MDPFERAGGATSYKEYINEITRIRLQPGKTQEDRDEEARKFAINEYPRNMLAEKLSSRPPLGERIERLQALIGAAPGAAAASGLTDDQLRAKFSESAKFVRNLANTDPEVMARIFASTLMALPAGRMLLQEKFGSRDPLEQKLYEANLASFGDLPSPRSPAQKLFESALASTVTGDLAPNEGGDLSLSPPSAADPASGTRIGVPDSPATEAQQVEALAKMLGPVAASMRPKTPAPHPTAAERPAGSLGIYLFWFVIAFSAAAIVASFAIK